MKKILLVAFVALLSLGLFSGPSAQAQTVNVTFVLNTATVPDTLLSTVTVTGDKAAITNWGAGAALTNIGGDYWSGTVAFTAGDSVRYKFRVNGAWESNSADPNGLSPDNRGLIVGTHDTTLPLQFYNVKGNGTPQYAAPWGTTPDSVVNIYFRVNMNGWSQANSFNAATDTVGVRGDKRNGSWGDANFQWGTTHFLTQETSASGGGFLYDATNFWSGTIQLRKSLIAAGDTGEYKFIINADWGRSDPNNRQFKIPTPVHDTTLYWVWFGDVKPLPPVAYTDTCIITFRTNMTTAINHGGFKIGDTLRLHSGYGGTASQIDRAVTMNRQGLTNIFAATDTIITKVGNELAYQYYLTRNATEIRENYFNFQWTGDPKSPDAEKRRTVVLSKNFTVFDTVATDISSGSRQPDFANQNNLTKNVTVKWVVDMRPAYYQVIYGHSKLIAIQGPDSVISADSIKVWGVGMNGPATNLPYVFPVTDWADWNSIMVADTNKRKMYDDGTHGDVLAGDSLYTLTYTYTTANVKGQVFKFGVGGSDNESGYGLNHLENISDADTTYTINAQWGSINPNFYNKWDYNNRRPQNLTSVDQEPGVALQYALNQNYPNPFNPSTKIQFSIPVTAKVQLNVFNILGQQVASLVNEDMKAGVHAVTFDASKLASGVYFYKLTAGNFVSTKKMLLLK